jgi:hypothetical protein
VSWDVERIRRFLYDHVETFEQLELLVAMAEDPSAEWTVEQGCQKLAGATPSDVREAFEHLVVQGFCVETPDAKGARFRFRPDSDELRTGVAAVRDLRAHSRTTIPTLMSRNAVDRMRAWTADTFADAFVLGRRKKDDA